MYEGMVYGSISIYIIIIGTLIASLVLAGNDVADFTTSGSDGKGSIDAVLLLSSFMSVLILFSLFSIFLLYRHRKINIFEANNNTISYFFTCNAIILAFSLLSIMPAIAVLTEINEATGFTVTYMIGSALAVLMPLLVVSVSLYKTKK
jgi:hypothetical protein